MDYRVEYSRNYKITSLISAERKFYVLDGDHREEYRRLKTYAECLEYFILENCLSLESYYKRKWSNKKMKTINGIVEDLEGLEVTELLEIHNEYCEENRYHEDIFYNLDEEYLELFYNGSLVDFTRSILNGTMDLNEPYIKSDIYRQLHTFKSSEIIDEMDLYELAAFVSERPELLETYIGE